MKTILISFPVTPTLQHAQIQWLMCWSHFAWLLTSLRLGGLRSPSWAKNFLFFPDTTFSSFSLRPQWPLFLCLFGSCPLFFLVIVGSPWLSAWLSSLWTPTPLLMACQPMNFNVVYMLMTNQLPNSSLSFTLLYPASYLIAQLDRISKTPQTYLPNTQLLIPRRVQTAG